MRGDRGERAAARIRRSIATSAVALLAAWCETAAALEFQCIEPSRYQSLVTVFDGDPLAFGTYLGLTREQRLQLDACRAVSVGGAITAGDADKLLDILIANKGGVAVLYLIASGGDIEEEARLSRIIRTLWLKTWVPRQPRFVYEPDFAATALIPPPSSTNAWSTAQQLEINPLDNGLREFNRGQKLALPVTVPNNVCNSGCALLYAAGVHRRITSLATNPAPADDPSGLEPDITRLRTILAYELERGTFPRPDERALSNAASADAMSFAPAPIVRAVRQACEPEFSAVEAVQRQMVGVVNEWAKKDFAAANVRNLLPRVEAIRKANYRLQQCIAQIYEKERVAAFQRLCGTECDKTRLKATFEQQAREFLDRARGLGPASAAK